MSEEASSFPPSPSLPWVGMGTLTMVDPPVLLQLMLVAVVKPEQEGKG